MNSDSIKKKIDALYADPKSKGFLNHLIKAYVPADKLQNVTIKPKDAKLVCVLTNDKLISVAEISAALLKNNPDLISIDQVSEKDIDDARKGKASALTGDKTNTFISQEAADALYEWITEKLLTGDSHIKWLINSMRNPNKPNGTFKKNLNGPSNGYRKPATTLGDLDSLQKLKAQFEAEEKN